METLSHTGAPEKLFEQATHLSKSLVLNKHDGLWLLFLGDGRWFTTIYTEKGTSCCRSVFGQVNLKRSSKSTQNSSSPSISSRYCTIVFTTSEAQSISGTDDLMVTPSENKGLIRPSSGKPTVNKPLTRPAISGGVHVGEVWLTYHKLLGQWSNAAFFVALGWSRRVELTVSLIIWIKSTEVAGCCIYPPGN